MKTNERASQIWHALVAVSTDKRTVTYKEVVTWTWKGASAQSVGNPLGLIQSYCALNHLPDLSAIVVKAGTGQPGSGHGRSDEVPKKQEEVFRHDWLRTPPPMSEDFSQDELKPQLRGPRV